MNRDFELFYARKSVFEHNWHSRLHTHTHSEMFYITGGDGIFQIGRNSIPVKAGDLIFINTGIPHTEISNDESPLEYIVLGIKGLETEYSDGNGYYSILKGAKAVKNALPLLEILVLEFENRQSDSDEICNHIFNAFIKLLLRDVKLVSAPVQLGNRSSTECAEVRRYIETHHKENLTLDSLAEYVHLNKYYLVHCFKAEYNTTPINYLQNKRISESKRLLTETDMSASQISAVLGFSSASHFTQCFKRIVGLPPTEFKKLNRKENTKL